MRSEASGVPTAGEVVPRGVFLVIVAVATVAVAGVWDQRREAAVAMTEFTQQQVVVARVAAIELQGRVAVIRRDAMVVADAERAGTEVPTRLRATYPIMRVRRATDPAWEGTNGDPSLILLSIIVDGGSRVVELAARRSNLVVSLGAVGGPPSMLVVRGPGERTFRAADGRAVEVPALDQAVAQGRQSFQVDHPNAVAFGLPERTGFAGVARFTDGALGTWDLAVATSAALLRDREERAGYRVLLGVVVTGGLGLLALFWQRRQNALGRALAVAEARREGDARLERASRAATLGTFALGVGHELATPLGVIAARAEQLIERPGDAEKVAANARSMLEQTARINQVVRGFLGLARGDTVTADDVGAGDVAKAAVQLVEHRFAQKGVSLAVADGDAARAMVRGDRRLLEHAVVNLLLNACDASAPGSTVTVSCTREGDEVYLAVLDEGAGISESDAKHVTEPFFTTKREGTGLGLAIVQEIVKSCRGRLAISARTPRGTACTIVLRAQATARNAGAGAGAIPSSW